MIILTLRQIGGVNRRDATEKSQHTIACVLRHSGPVIKRFAYQAGGRQLPVVTVQDEYENVHQVDATALPGVPFRHWVGCQRLEATGALNS
jgi:hypothetical protein